MKVIFGISKFKASWDKAVIVIGVFDGVHIGHQHLITSAVSRAKALNVPCCLLTFHPHPVHVLRQDISKPLITSLQHRMDLIRLLGVDCAIVLPFTKSLAQISPEMFLKNYLIEQLKAVEIFVGSDFRFGKDRSGSIEFFKGYEREYGFKIKTIQPLLQGENKIGSSQVRSLISQGDLNHVRKLLGRDHEVYGPVIKGDARGRLFGYPTANVLLGEEILPPFGVYAVRVRWNGCVWNGVANLGVRPSLNNLIKMVSLEVHVMDFEKDIYGETLAVSFLKKIRDEQHFPSLEALFQQIKNDEQSARDYFSANE